MNWVAHLILIIIHTVYGLKNLIFSFIPRRAPRPLLVRRQKSPGHVALILVPDAENHDTRDEEAVLEECVERAVKWCKAVGIQRLSVYERDGESYGTCFGIPAEEFQGILSHKSIYVSSAPSDDSLLSPDMHILDRLTPPTSDTESPKAPPQKLEEPSLTFRPYINTIQLPSLPRKDSAEIAQQPHRRKDLSYIFDSKPQQHNLTLHILSRQSSKPSLATVTRYFAKKQRKSDGKFTLSVDELNTTLEVESGYPPPNLIIVYPLYPSTASLELHGFPPWHMRLSEVFPSRRRLATTALPISERDFRRALDEYSDAQFNLGK
ncbi:hypothetical protein BU17DRAFT_44219 [Hysterangium stoloniferum]|nr:hypothetical protein BU17DRAFT_44219 [Hysterangium stoloniferum]